MTVINGVAQNPSKSTRKMETDAFNAIRFIPGAIPPILPCLNICNMVPKSHTHIYDPHTKAHSIRDDWVLQSLNFYAHPEHEFHPDYANKLACKRNRWTMYARERNPTSQETRIILLEPTFNPQGQLHGFTMCLESTENATSHPSWAIQHFRLDLTPYKPPNDQHPRDFYHHDWVAYLNYRACQNDYMRLLPSDRTGFFVNMAVVLIRIGVIDISARKTLTRMIEESLWNNKHFSQDPPELPTVVSPSMIFNKR